YNSSQSKAKKLSQTIQDLGVACEIFQADLTNPNELEHLIPAVKKTFPKLSLLINNAAIFQKAQLTQTDQTLFDSHFDLNLKAPFFLTRDFARICKKGLIINILDTRISQNRSSHFAYTLSKKALADFTRLAAAELAPNIQVNAIAPGYILPPTNINQKNTEKTTPELSHKNKAPLKTVTNSIRFLIENNHLTQEIIFADEPQNL
ncbi:MAG: SDR family NAD(P)-dependent oxidoreductase, partial [Planctomycetes bacterium]|nr:SDR family NAD(P)-dependent oxidoreductase [Planctomycetota bacterium]